MCSGLLFQNWFLSRQKHPAEVVKMSRLFLHRIICPPPPLIVYLNLHQSCVPTTTPTHAVKKEVLSLHLPPNSSSFFAMHIEKFLISTFRFLEKRQK